MFIVHCATFLWRLFSRIDQVDDDVQAVLDLQHEKVSIWEDNTFDAKSILIQTNVSKIDILDDIDLKSMDLNIEWFWYWAKRVRFWKDLYSHLDIKNEVIGHLLVDQHILTANEIVRVLKKAGKKDIFIKILILLLSRHTLHSSERRSLCSVKLSSEMFQNLSYFWKKKTQIVF